MTEDSFQLILDDDPTNSGTRLMFADWLEERRDWRATGYRWMGENGKWPLGLKYHTRPVAWAWAKTTLSGHQKYEHCYLPSNLNKHFHPTGWAFDTRRTAEEALCRALMPTCRRCHGSGRIKTRVWHGPNVGDDEASFSKSRCPDCDERLVMA